jgi:hypothetical protein
MERMRNRERPRAIETVREDAGGRLAVDAGMIVFLIGLALLFVANGPS